MDYATFLDSKARIAEALVLLLTAKEISASGIARKHILSLQFMLRRCTCTSLAIYRRKPFKTVISAPEMRFIFIPLMVGNLDKSSICCGISEIHGVSMPILVFVRRDGSNWLSGDGIRRCTGLSLSDNFYSEISSRRSERRIQNVVNRGKEGMKNYQALRGWQNDGFLEFN